MTGDELRAVIRQALTDVAPDIDPRDVIGPTRLREDLDLDSLDFLDVVTAVREATGIEIPERDYGRLDTLDSFADYLDEAG